MVKIKDLIINKFISLANTPWKLHGGKLPPLCVSKLTLLGH
jgi:hypothetical protein